MVAEEKLTKLTEDSESIGSECKICGEALVAGDEAVFCPRCHTPHHLACWKRNRGCGSMGCPQLAEVYKEDEVRAGRDDERKPKPNYRPYIFGGIILVLLIVAYQIFWPKPPDPAAGKIALHFMIEGGSREMAFYDQVTTEFNDMQDDIYVFSQTVPPGGYEQKLIIMIGARDAPDIFTLRLSRMQIYADGDVLMKLEERLQNSELLRGQDFGGRLQKTTFDGSVLALPHTGVPQAFAITTLGKHPEESWKFLEFLASEVISDWPEEWNIEEESGAQIPFSPSGVPGF